MSDKVKISHTLEVLVGQLRGPPVTHPKAMPNILQPLKICSQWLAVLHQVIQPLSHGIVIEHGENLDDRGPVHPQPRSRTRFDNDERVLGKLVEVRVPFESVPSLFRLLCRRTLRDGL